MDWYEWSRDIFIPAVVGFGTLALAFVSFLIARSSHDTAEQSLGVAAKALEAQTAANVAAERHHEQLIETETRDDRKRVASAVRAWYQDAGNERILELSPSAESAQLYEKARLAAIELNDSNVYWYLGHLRDQLDALGAPSEHYSDLIAKDLEIHKLLQPIMLWITNPRSLELYRKSVLDRDGNGAPPVVLG
jgi:hypothetical protein